MTSPEQPLAALRREIDAIDDAIHDLLMQRARVVAGVRAAKGTGAESIHRHGREAQILRRLAARHEGQLPVTVIAALWRQIISASSGLQGVFDVYVARQPAHLLALARTQFGVSGVMHPCATSAAVVRRVQARGGAAVGVVELPRGGAPWWRGLGAGARAPIVQACLPLIGRGPGGLVIAADQFWPSGDDRGFVLVATRQAARAILRQARAAGLAPLRAAAATRGLALIETEGYVPPDDARLAALAAALGVKPGAVRSAGGYAAPIRAR